MEEHKAVQLKSSTLIKVIATLALVFGILLLSLNLYGLTQSIRKPGLGVVDYGQLRFIPDEVWSYDDSLNAIAQLDSKNSASRIAERANMVVNKSLVHVDWERVDPEEYRQLVPVWENYFLHLVGRFSGLPQFERYHYSDYRRNIKRGIGICGDASTILSSILDKYDIDNRIVSFDGHVIVEYVKEDGKRSLLDPDFGVDIGASLDELIKNPESKKSRYLSAGYSESEVEYLFEAYNDRYSIFDNTYEFMTLRYIFERLSYVLKWVVPLVLIVLAMILIAVQDRRTSKVSENPVAGA